MLPDELLEQLQTSFPCRELQIRQLSALYSARLPSPSLLTVYGLEATGKTSIVRGVLRANSIQHCIVNSRECITGRHLLERTVASCLDALDQYDDAEIDRKPYARCENISALVVHLQRMMEERTEKFVLVFDGIDRQREAPPTLLPSLARFGEMIPHLSILLITRFPLPLALHSPGAPHLPFPPYTRAESIHILSQSPPKIFLTPPDPEKFPDYTADLAAEDDAWLWGRFLGTVWDTMSKHVGRDLVSFRTTALRMWRPFVTPVVAGELGTRHFVRLMVRQRSLFQGEEPLLNRVVPKESRFKENIKDTLAVGTVKKKPLHLDTDILSLPHYTHYLLIAAYLASYNPARTDSTYFMTHADGRKNRRRVKNTPLSSSVSLSKSKNAKNHRRIPRHLLTPSPFPLDRLFAIFRSLVEGEREGSVPQTGDLLGMVRTLASLRLLVRAGVGGEVEGGGKWRVAFGWEWVRGIGRGVGVEVGEWLVGGVDG
ncbi:hypothetical protein GQ43DRAFT_425071 [Delitschia confertaspora ATCC 74209]|uniref:Orc1-like AAA ATPase domain-containing protein n=1 Tax=Delitschia confertaspora ATCC 74209 TaxID=1513339 RepID=A0A9P4JDL7_9PLEO|nr:hypothetical protein GQ43DRAFT_425071 [Delitschia confertaspora ATCC 74209]